MVPRRGLLPMLSAVARRRSAILGYHGVAEPHTHDPLNLCVAPAVFEAHIQLLSDAGFEFVTVAQLGDELHAGEVAPGRIALSFDDGMEDNHHNALPILRRYGIPATVYVVTGLVGQPNEFLSGARMMTAEEIQEVAAHGVEIGAHTVTHADLSTLGYDDCLREMTESLAYIERLLGHAPRSFAYPFCRYGEEAIAAARDAGFATAVTCERGRWAPYELRRSMIGSPDGLGRLTLKLAGIHEPMMVARRRALRAAKRLRLHGGRAGGRDVSQGPRVADAGD